MTRNVGLRFRRGALTRATEENYQVVVSSKNQHLGRAQMEKRGRLED